MKTVKFAFILLTLFSPLAFSQQAPNQPAPTVTKVVRIRYGIAQKIAGLVAPGLPVEVNADNLLQVVVLKGSPSIVASAEQIIHELDVPSAAVPPQKSKSIELVVSVIGGSNNTELTPEGPTPEALAPVMKQLRAVFPYKNYQVLSTMLLRSSEHAKAQSDGVMRNLTNSGSTQLLPNGYTVAYGESSVSLEEARPVIYLRDFIFRTTNISIRTDINLREGQKVVAGKANIDSSDLALFVVLTARLVE